jgi:hypothetical protein
MNLIQLSEQLKDVHDSVLLKEVERPSGAYPSYLIVSEMGRRKRMRDQAAQEAPSSTVAEDFARPTREQLMAAMARRQAMQAQAMQAQPLTDPMSLIQSQAQRVNAPGIMAAPQAADTLAAQDVMGAQPTARMAGGGMVAFAQGGDIHYDDRGAIRFNNQGTVPSTGLRYGMRFEDLPEPSVRYASTLPDILGNLFSRPGERIDPVTGDPISFGEFKRRQEAEAIKAATPAAMSMIPAAPAMATARSTPTPSPAATPASAPAASAATTQAGAPSAAPVPAGLSVAMPKIGDIPTAPKYTPYVNPNAGEMQRALERIVGHQDLTEGERAGERAAGIARYQEENPFRLGFLEKDIADRQRALEGRRGSNVNEALIQAGLGIMGSKSPRFLQAAGEGGTAGLNAYRQGLKDIREGERDLTQSRVAFANAQSLYDQGKSAAGDRALEQAERQRDRGLAKSTSVYAALVKDTDVNLALHEAGQKGKFAEHKAGIEGLDARMKLATLPSEIAVRQAQAGAYGRMHGERPGRQPDTTPSPTEISTALDAARRQINEEIGNGTIKGVKLMSPEHSALVKRLAEDFLRAANKPYSFPSLTTGVPAAGSPGALPPGWSVQVR